MKSSGFSIIYIRIIVSLSKLFYIKYSILDYIKISLIYMITHLQTVNNKTIVKMVIMFFSLCVLLLKQKHNYGPDGPGGLWNLLY